MLVVEGTISAATPYDYGALMALVTEFHSLLDQGAGGYS